MMKLEMKKTSGHIRLHFKVQALTNTQKQMFDETTIKKMSRIKQKRHTERQKEKQKEGKNLTKTS